MARHTVACVKKTHGSLHRDMHDAGGRDRGDGGGRMEEGGARRERGTGGGGTGGRGRRGRGGTGVGWQRGWTGGREENSIALPPPPRPPSPSSVAALHHQHGPAHPSTTTSDCPADALQQHPALHVWLLSYRNLLTHHVQYHPTPQKDTQARVSIHSMHAKRSPLLPNAPLVLCSLLHPHTSSIYSKLLQGFPCDMVVCGLLVQQCLQEGTPVATAVPAPGTAVWVRNKLP